MGADGAMAAKARAMFGKRLLPDDYEELLQKKSIQEIVSYLKGSEMYKSTMDGVNEKSVHRGQLEVLLRLSVYDRLSRLLKYGEEKDKRYLVAAVMNIEIEMVLVCIRILAKEAGDEEREQLITRMPVYIAHYMSFDITKLADVRTYEELLVLVKGTEYYSILQNYRNETLKDIDLISLEHDLRDAYLLNLMEMAEQNVRGEEREKLKRMISMRCELDDLAVIYRLKKYFVVPSEKIIRQVSNVNCLFSKKELETMVKEASAEEVIAAITRKYHRYIRGAKFTYIEKYIEQITYNMYYTTIETDTDEYPVLMSYMNLSVTEIRNLINIIEGARYKVSSGRIRALLVY